MAELTQEQIDHHIETGESLNVDLTVDLSTLIEVCNHGFEGGLEGLNEYVEAEILPHTADATLADIGYSVIGYRNDDNPGHSLIVGAVVIRVTAYIEAL